MLFRSLTDMFNICIVSLIGKEEKKKKKKAVKVKKKNKINTEKVPTELSQPVDLSTTFGEPHAISLDSQ